MDRVLEGKVKLLENCSIILTGEWRKSNSEYKKIIEAL